MLWWTGLLDGFPLPNSASAPLFVNNPPTTSIVAPTKGAADYRSFPHVGHLQTTCPVAFFLVAGLRPRAPPATHATVGFSLEHEMLNGAPRRDPVDESAQQSTPSITDGSESGVPRAILASALSA